VEIVDIAINSFEPPIRMHQVPSKVGVESPHGLPRLFLTFVFLE